MKKRLNCRKGFTLIELLVVILIILVLSGMLFKVAGMIGNKAARARAIADIEKIQHALTEFYSEYGIYPPTNGNSYEYENAGSQPAGMVSFLAANGPGSTRFVTDAEVRVVPTPANQYQSSWGCVGYRYGLVSYLYLRQRGAQPHWYDADTERDINAKRRWAHFLEGLTLEGGGAGHTLRLPEASYDYTNSVKTIDDPWGRGYQYRCPSPHSSYDLWSTGPDANSDRDDIHNDSYSE